MTMDKIAEGLRKTVDASDLLDRVYKDLRKHKEVTKETIVILRLFYKNHDKFIDVYMREQRRLDGCRTYRDHKGKVRIVSTGKLDE